MTTRLPLYVEAGELTDPRERPNLLQLGGRGLHICCPKCAWVPQSESLWGCKCDTNWNTFDTGGCCPSCRTQWLYTVCLQCRKVSPHAEWYSADGSASPPRA